MSELTFVEVGARIYLLTYPVYRVNSVLIDSDHGAIVIDTLSTARQAGELLDAVRRVTTQPLTIVNTHFHFDHTFGNSVLAPSGPVWGHPTCAQELGERGEHWRRYWQQEIAEEDEELALEIGDVPLLPPDRLVSHEQELDLGGRKVILSHHGRGHTEGDVVVRVDDFLIAGDLVEEGAPPSFEDSYPLEWPDTVASLLELPFERVIPGHGRVMDRSDVEVQHGELTKLDWLIRDGHSDSAPVERVVKASPLSRKWGEAGRVQSMHAARRGYAQLDGG
ncbi:MAG TPA: MBL fold metallo-hydrolase [Candidatus Limnocylindrales bacterium]|nr:MBL fold metallo-hydrolase [Candidatus Limnocylindrales bacterium]